MIVEYGPKQVRFERGTPVAAGEQELRSPTQVVRTPAGGFWALYQVGGGALVVYPWRAAGIRRAWSLLRGAGFGAIQGTPEEVGERLRAIAGDRGNDADDREAAASFLRLVDPDVDDPGKAPGTPRSLSGETGLPPSYPLSGPRNVPSGPTGSSSGASVPQAPPEE